MEKKSIKTECLLDVCSLTEEQCRQKLFKIKWGETPTCPDCACTYKISFITTRNVYKCLECRRQFSLTQGTIFEGTKLPLKKWFVAIFLIGTDKGGISSVQLGKHLKVPQNTAWHMLQKLRSAMNEDIQNLGGIVEIDETQMGSTKTKDKRLALEIRRKKEVRIRMEAEGFFEKQKRLLSEAKKDCRKGRKPKKRKFLSEIYYDLPYLNRRLLEDREVRNILYQPLLHKKYVVGMIERDIFDEYGNLIKLGRLYLTKIGRHKGDICRRKVEPHIIKKVCRSAHVMTDDNRIYYRLKEKFSAHSIIKHSKSGVHQQFARHVDGDVSTNCIDNVWKQVKKVEKGTYVHYSWKYTDLYLCAFSYRYNRRQSKPEDIFEDLLTSLANTVVKRKELYDLPGKYIYFPR